MSCERLENRWGRRAAFAPVSRTLDARKGTCDEPFAMPRMHSLSASSDLLISALSVRSWRLCCLRLAVG